MSVGVTPAAGGTLLSTLPSAVQDLARFFLSLSGSSSLGAVSGIAGVAASAAGSGDSVCPSTAAGDAVTLCTTTVTPAGAGVPPAVPGVSGEQQRQEESRSRRHRRRSSSDGTDGRSKKRSRRRSPSPGPSSRRRERHYRASSDSSEEDRADVSPPRTGRAPGGTPGDARSSRAYDRSPRPGTSRSFARKERYRSGAGRRFPAPSGAADDDRSSAFESVDSPYEGWGMPVSALEAVAGNWSRDLGGDRSSGRLLCPVQGLSSSSIPHSGIVSDVPGRLSSGSGLAARGRGDACQRSLGNRPRSGSRLLQSPLPSGESFWRLETRDRSLAFERLRPTDTVQDGSSRFGAVICQRGGFCSFLGSEGRILSDPDPWIIEEAVEVHVGGDGLPVPSSVLRTVDRSPGLHQGLRGRVSLGTLPRDQTSPLSGRLVGPLLFGEGGQTGHPVAALALSHPRDCDKREEVGSRALADCEVPRYDHRYRSRQGFFVSGASREIPVSGGEILCYGIPPSSALAGDPRSPVLARAVGSSRSSSDALIAVASEDALVP